MALKEQKRKMTLFILTILSIILIANLTYSLNLNFNSPTYSNGSVNIANSFSVNLTNSDTDRYYSLLDLDKSLIGIWRMENPLIDESTYSNNFTCTSCPTSSAGFFGNASSFNQSNFLIKDINNIKLNTTANTISFWAFENSAQTTNTFFQIGTNINCQDVGDPYIDLNRVSTNSLRAYIRGQYTPSFLVTNNTWHNFVIVYDGINSTTIYKDGLLVLSFNSTVQKGNYRYLCIGRGLNGYFNGTIDEFIVLNRSIDYSEVLSIYNSSAYGYYTNFTNKSFGNYTFKGYGVNISGTLKVTDFRTITLTNITAPNILFSYQSPSDLSTSEQSANIQYNVTMNGGTLNLSSVKLFYKTNSTLHDSCWVFVNQTGDKCGFVQSNYLSNQSDSFLFHLDDDEIYPAVYPLLLTSFENTIHSTGILGGSSDYIKQKMFNISSTELFNQIEGMITRTSGSTSSLRTYYCNSTYLTGDPSTSLNCLDFFDLPNTVTYNHTEGNSSYNIFPMIVNVTSGKIGNIIITPTSYFLFRGIAGSQWTYSYISQIARQDVTQLSINGGTSWTNLSGTFDMHIHQYDGNDNLNYYSQFCNTLGMCSTSLIRTDLLQIGNQKPSQPIVTFPINYYYMGNISINYSQSISPNGYAIVSYNVSLLNRTNSFNKTLSPNNYPNLTFILNTALYPDDYYKINVTACDINGLCSDGVSTTFLLDNTPPFAFVLDLNGTLSNLDYHNFSVFASDDVNVSNVTFNLYNSSGSLIHQNITSTSVTSGVFSFIYNFVTDGIFHWFYVVSDFAGNIVTTVTKYITINTGVPLITIDYPQNTTYAYTIVGMNFTIAGLTDSCWYSLNNGAINTTIPCSSSSINNITSEEGLNYWSISANNTFGNLTTKQVIFNSTCQNPEVTLSIPTYPYIDVNTSTQLRLSSFIASSSKIKMILTNTKNNEKSYFNFTYDGIDSYILNIIFVNESDYNFVIYGDNICPTVVQNITGTFLVRKPFNVDVRLFNRDGTPIVDNYGYITVEYVGNLKIDPILENYIHPIADNRFYEKTFHAPYINGLATIKLYEPKKDYVFRYITGVVQFESTYSKPNITKSYGENVYLGTQNLNGTNVLEQFVLESKDLHPYRFLANWIVIILIIGIGIISMFMFFLIPDKPTIALIFGTLFSFILIVLRLIVWIWTGN
jgi:hypothetical protein